jgi:2-hydroxychromene-2-carboxylate isomerase
MGGARMSGGAGAKFFYDVGSPYAWVVAERASKAIPEAEWIPVCQPDVDDGPLWDGDQERIIELAQKFSLIDPRFNEDRMNLTIADSRKMALAATYAKSIGRTIAFSLAAFRQCFGAGLAVDEENTILLAGAACEMHPRAILQALEMRSTTENLATAAQTLRDLTGGRTELPVLIPADGEPITEDELIALAIADFRSTD